LDFCSFRFLILLGGVNVPRDDWIAISLSCHTQQARLVCAEKTNAYEVIQGKERLETNVLSQSNDVSANENKNKRKVKNNTSDSSNALKEGNIDIGLKNDQPGEKSGDLAKRKKNNLYDKSVEELKAILRKKNVDCSNLVSEDKEYLVTLINTSQAPKKRNAQESTTDNNNNNNNNSNNYDPVRTKKQKPNDS
jgi:hypothetical protein